ncbi:Hypothetical predicted protein [Drosophila guanche]|uniref:Uncharacterized protein n=1 Tax=Drosophila guanche TaxID=7266 RepID=A0A3B0K2Y3_DROGU|nr:Hypothetical predicted protein [Drosophila guanche]
MAATATVSSHVEAKDGKVDLVCEECDYYGSTATILIDSSTQTDGDADEDEDDESEVKPVRTKLAQIVEEAEAEAETEVEATATPAINGIRNNGAIETHTNIDIRHIDNNIDSVTCNNNIECIRNDNNIDNIPNGENINCLDNDIIEENVVSDGQVLEEPNIDAVEGHIPNSTEQQEDDIESEDEVEPEQVEEAVLKEEQEVEPEQEQPEEDQIDNVARLTGLALEMGYARIIDYDNFRIIEHVIESDDDDDDDGDVGVVQGPVAGTSQELHQACHDLVTFIGESYQSITTTIIAATIIVCQPRVINNRMEWIYRSN